MLSNYRVLDLTDERGHLAGLMLRQLGAEVIAIEPPQGSSARRLGPFAPGEVSDGEHSLHHWAYNRGKKSVVLDLDTPDGQAELKKLAAGADILLESEDPGVMAARGLGYDDLSAENEALIYVSITAFGSDGPKANWHATDLIIQASAGNMAITGDTDRAPLRAGGTLPQAYHNAASEAAGAALMALFERQRASGRGQYIDASAQQSMNQSSQSMSLAASLAATSTTRIAGGASLQGIPIQLMWPCADGHASVTLLFGAAFARFTQNLMNWVHEEGFCDEATRDKDWVEYPFMLLDGREPIEEYDRVKQTLTDFFATKTKAQLLDGGNGAPGADHPGMDHRRGPGQPPTGRAWLLGDHRTPTVGRNSLPRGHGEVLGHPTGESGGCLPRSVPTPTPCWPSLPGLRPHQPPPLPQLQSRPAAEGREDPRLHVGHGGPRSLAGTGRLRGRDHPEWSRSTRWTPSARSLRFATTSPTRRTQAAGTT